jgi:hypothetical protein
MYNYVNTFDSFEDIEEIVTPGNGSCSCCNN